MKKFTYLIISAINAGLMALYITFAIPAKQVALHFNFNGEVDRCGSKWELLILAGIPFVLSLIYAIINLVINYMEIKSKNEKYFSRIFGGIFLFLLIVFWVILFFTNNLTKINRNTIFSLVNVLCGILFILIGNILPKVKPNSIAGLRTKATMSNEFVWRKANRLSGFLAVMVGCAGVILSIIGFIIKDFAVFTFITTLALFLITQIITVIYANILAKKGYPNG